MLFYMIWPLANIYRSHESIFRLFWYWSQKLNSFMIFLNNDKSNRLLAWKSINAINPGTLNALVENWLHCTFILKLFFMSELQLRYSRANCVFSNSTKSSDKNEAFNILRYTFIHLIMNWSSSNTLGRNKLLMWSESEN